MRRRSASACLRSVTSIAMVTKARRSAPIVPRGVVEKSQIRTRPLRVRIGDSPARGWSPPATSPRSVVMAASVGSARTLAIQADIVGAWSCV